MQKKISILILSIFVLCMCVIPYNLHAQPVDIDNTADFISALEDDTISEINLTADINVSDAGIQYFSLEHDVKITGNNHLISGGFSIDGEGLNLEFNHINLTVPDSSMAIYLSSDVSVGTVEFIFTNFLMEDGALGILPEQLNSISTGTVKFDTCTFDYTQDIGTKWPISQKADDSDVKLVFDTCTFYNNIPSNPEINFIYTKSSNNSVEIVDSDIYGGIIHLDYTKDSVISGTNFDHSSLVLNGVSDFNVRNNTFVQPFQNYNYGILLNSSLGTNVKDLLISQNVFVGIGDNDEYNGNAIAVSESFDMTNLDSGDIVVDHNDFSFLRIGTMAVINNIGGSYSNDNSKIMSTNNKLPVWIDTYSDFIDFFDNFHLGKADVSTQTLETSYKIPYRIASLNVYDPADDPEVFIPDIAAYTWESLTPDIASVDTGGRVVGKVNGIANIRYTMDLFDGNYIEDEYEVEFANITNTPTGDPLDKVFIMMIVNLYVAAFIFKYLYKKKFA